MENKNWNGENNVVKCAANGSDVLHTQSPVHISTQSIFVGKTINSHQWRANWGQVCCSVEIPNYLFLRKYFLDLALCFLEIFSPLALTQLESYFGVK